jgi:hypothetical protein
MRPSRPTRIVQHPAGLASITMATGAWSTSGPVTRPGCAASTASMSTPLGSAR